MAGVAVALEVLDELAGLLGAVAVDVAALAPPLVAAATDVDLLLGALPRPGATADVLVRLAHCTGALAVAAGVVAALSAAVASAARAYQGVEAGAARSSEALMAGLGAHLGLLARSWWAVGSSVGAPVGALLLPVVATGTLLVAPPLRRGAADVVVGHPRLVGTAVRLTPGLLGVRDVPAAAGAVLDLGRATGLVRPSAVHVSERADKRTACRPARDLAGLLGRTRSVAASGGPGQVRVDRVQGADGEVSWVVHVPGTREWDTDGRGSPMDMTTNLEHVAGRPTAVGAGVRAAMARAGVGPGQPVLVVGHSQGGMTALELAAPGGSGRAAVASHVVTAGSPVAGRPVADGVRVLALEHRDDLVPGLDGRSHPDTRRTVTVRTTSPVGPWRSDAVPAHSSAAYVRTARALAGADHPSLTAAQAELAPFLDRPGARCESRQFALQRSPGRDGDVTGHG